MYAYKEIYFKELAFIIMEADKSQDLQWASWRHRRAGDVFPDGEPAGASPRRALISVLVQRKD